MDTMSLAEIMDRSFDILRKYIKTIVIYSIGYGITALIGLLILLFLAGIVGAIIAVTIGGDFFANPPDILVFTFMILIGFLYFVIVMTISSGYQVGISKITSQEFFDTRFYAAQVIKTALKSIIKVLGIVITAFLLSIPFILIFGFVFYRMFPIIDSIFTANVFGLGEVMIIILMVILLLIVTLFILAYTTIFIFSIPVMVIEQKTVINSIKRSYELVKNKFWKIFATIILFVLIVYAINISLQSFVGLITGIAYLIMKLLSLEINYFSFMTSIYQYANGPLVLINWLIIGPISSIMLTLLYFNRRFEREGYDIILNVMRIQENTERKQSSDSSTR